MPRRKEPRISDAVLDQLLAGADAKSVFEPNGLIDHLKKALAERVLNAEMDHRLAGEEPGNWRNGYGKKTVITDTGRIELSVPRDRQARFDPQLIARYQRVHPVAQGLPIHRADPSRRTPILALIGRRDRQQPASLVGIFHFS